MEKLNRIVHELCENSNGGGLDVKEHSHCHRAQDVNEVPEDKQMFERNMIGRMMALVRNDCKRQKNTNIRMNHF